MSFQFSTTARNAALDAIETAIGTAPDARTAVGRGTGQLRGGRQRHAAGQHGAALGLDGRGLGRGQGPVRHLDGQRRPMPRARWGITKSSKARPATSRAAVTITGGGGDMTLDNPVLAVGQQVTITAFTSRRAGHDRDRGNPGRQGQACTHPSLDRRSGFRDIARGCVNSRRCDAGEGLRSGRPSASPQVGAATVRGQIGACPIRAALAEVRGDDPCRNSLIAYSSRPRPPAPGRSRSAPLSPVTSPLPPEAWRTARRCATSSRMARPGRSAPASIVERDDALSVARLVLDRRALEPDGIGAGGGDRSGRRHRGADRCPGIHERRQLDLGEACGCQTRPCPDLCRRQGRRRRASQGRHIDCRRRWRWRRRWRSGRALAAGFGARIDRDSRRGRGWCRRCSGHGIGSKRKLG